MNLIEDPEHFWGTLKIRAGPNEDKNQKRTSEKEALGTSFPYKKGAERLLFGQSKPGLI